MSTRHQASIERVIAERELLREWCVWVRRDPRINAWEQEFASSIYRSLDSPHRAFLSRKQKVVVWALAVKTRFRGLPRDLDAETEPDGEDQEESP